MLFRHIEKGVGDGLHHSLFTQRRFTFRAVEHNGGWFQTIASKVIDEEGGIGHGTTGGRTKALIDYRHSLRETAKMPIELMFGGHGDPILDHVDLIDRRLASQDRRTEKIFELVSEEPRTGHGIADAIWGNIALTQAYLTLSEVVGHLDILLEEGRVVETTRPLEDSDLELTFYEATK